MKKIIYPILGIIIIICCFVLLTKKETKTNKITLAEVTHSAFYTPLYVAIENGYFKENNIDLKLILTPGADKVSAAVLSGDAQIGFAGAESAIYILNGNEKDYLQIFSGLTKRDGQFILSKEKINNFSLKDLYGKEILVGRSSGMPALNFLNALKKENIDSSKININFDVDFASLSGAFIGGTGEFVNLYEPNAIKLEKEGLGYVVGSIGLFSGEMPYTTFYARKSYINNNKDIINNFKDAIQKGLDYTFSHTDKEVAKKILNQFPDTSLDDLTTIIKRYRESDSWLNNTSISEELLKNLENIMIDNNLLDNYIDYNKLIVN